MGTSADLNRILNVRVGRYFVCAKPPLRRAESRFAEPRFSLWEGFNFASAKPPLRRAEARFGKPRKVSKGFNFVSGKLLFGCADSRFAKPRCSSARERLVTFCVVQKVTKKHAGLRPATCDSNLRSIHNFCRSDRRSSSNRPRRVLQAFRISPVRI